MAGEPGRAAYRRAGEVEPTLRRRNPSAGDPGDRRGQSRRERSRRPRFGSSSRAHGRLRDFVESGRKGRPGPVFIEVCLDAQAAPAVADCRRRPHVTARQATVEAPSRRWSEALDGLRTCRTAPDPSWRGGEPGDGEVCCAGLEVNWHPVGPTWNAMDRLPADSPVYAGRPNTWGMRWANIVIQQCDFLLASGPGSACSRRASPGRSSPRGSHRAGRHRPRRVGQGPARRSTWGVAGRRGVRRWRPWCDAMLNPAPSGRDGRDFVAGLQRRAASGRAG